MNMREMLDSCGSRPAFAGGVGILLTTVVLGCATSADPQPCSEEATLPLAGGNCLVFDDGGLLDAHRSAIQRVLEEAATRIIAVMPITGVAIHVGADAQQTIPEQGIGGYAPNGREVLLNLDPVFPALASSIENELGPTMAHEMHHARRWQTRGYGSSLLEAVISEGLADHFSIELFGVDPPPWCIAVSGPDLDDLMERAEQTWNQQPYDRSLWFFGTDPAIPRWAGYSIGFELVRKYLEAHPTRRPSELYAESAQSFS